MAAAPPVRRYLRYVGILNDDAATRLLRAVEVARELGATEIHIGVNMIGGFTPTAVALHNSLLNSATRIVLYNIGSVSSAGVTAFLGGHERYTSAHGRFMIHSHTVAMNETFARSRLDDLLVEFALEENRVDRILRARTQINDDDLASRRVRDVHYSAEQAVAVGIVHGIREFATHETIFQV